MGIVADFFKEWGKHRPKLQEELPQVMATVTRLRDETYKDGALSRQVKELIALGIGISRACEACIMHHTHNALQAGATKEQILEAISVAIQMGGGPAVGEGVKALRVVEELTSGAKPE